MKKILSIILWWFFIWWFFFININIYLHNVKINNNVLLLKNNIKIFEEKWIINNKNICEEYDFSCKEFIKIEENIIKKWYKINNSDIYEYSDKNLNKALINNLSKRKSMINKINSNSIIDLENRMKKEKCLDKKNYTEKICEDLFNKIEYLVKEWKQYTKMLKKNKKDELMIKYFKLKKELFIDYQKKKQKYFLFDF